MPDIHKRLRLLEAWAGLSLLGYGVLVCCALAPAKQSFDEISVQRLDVVDADGQLRLVIANAAHMPDPVIHGKTFATERPPGMLFYNGLGDECGGLVFGAAASADQYGAYAGLSFDQYAQSQAVALVYNDHDGVRQAGLSVWDRPETPLTDLLERGAAVEKLPDGAEKDAARASLRAAEQSPTRVFVGKSKEREAKVTLYDDQGRARINMLVDATGAPRLDFLDESGKVTYSLPQAH